MQNLKYAALIVPGFLLWILIILPLIWVSKGMFVVLKRLERWVLMDVLDEAIEYNEMDIK